MKSVEKTQWFILFREMNLADWRRRAAESRSARSGWLLRAHAVVMSNAVTPDCRRAICAAAWSLQRLDSAPPTGLGTVIVCIQSKLLSLTCTGSCYQRYQVQKRPALHRHHLIHTWTHFPSFVGNGNHTLGETAQKKTYNSKTHRKSTPAKNRAANAAWAASSSSEFHISSKITRHVMRPKTKSRVVKSSTLKLSSSCDLSWSGDPEIDSGLAKQRP